MINLSVCAGLSNRIKPIASSFLFPQHQLRVNWSPNYINMHKGRQWLSPFIGDWNYYFKNRLERCEYEYNDSNIVSYKGEDVHTVGTYKFLRYEEWGDYDLLFDNDPHKEEMFNAFKRLEPVDIVVEQVERFWCLLGSEQTLGVQVRVFQQHEIDVWRYILEAEKYPDHRILIVTDCPKTRDLFYEHFGESVVDYKKGWDLHDTMLERSNLIEMLLLAKCKNTLLSSGSTFGECAYYFAGGSMKPTIIPYEGQPRYV